MRLTEKIPPNPHSNPGGRYCHYHFAEGETETLRAYVTVPDFKDGARTQVCLASESLICTAL